MLDDKTLARLDALALRLKNRTRGAAGGARHSSALGSSAEFSDFREYVPGDDVRRVDWNAYARFERLFLKLFMEEQEAEITLLVDASRSMKAKWETCLVCAEMLGYLALTGGEPAHASEMLALNIYQTFYVRSGPQWKGIGQAKAVLFCILVIAISSLQLKLTKSKEVQQ